METVYTHNGASLLSDGKHYYTKTKEDYKVISEHLDYVMRHTSKFSQEYKDAKWLFCDLFIKKCYLLTSDQY